VAILKGYDFSTEELNSHLLSITHQFKGKSQIHYKLNDKSYLTLTKDNRKETVSKRYPNSPFPYLSNVEKFRNTVGQWNSSLQEYKIKTRLKLGDEIGTSLNSNESIGTHVYLS
jgi:hypothetical protein